MMAEGDQDKTEQPTQYRLEEARRQGQVAKSADVVGALGLAAFATTVVMTASAVAAVLAEATRQVIGLAGAHPGIDRGLGVWIWGLYSELLQHLLPLVLALVVVAVVANVMQTGPIFSTHPLKPDFKRLSPSNAIKRLFSIRAVWEAGKLVTKLLLLLVVVWFATRAAPRIVGEIASAPPGRLPGLLLDNVWRMSLWLLLVLGILAVADLLFVRRDHLKRMRMSRRELRDETKRRDGDPEIKSRQKKKLRELLKKVRALPRAGEADVILTNPTEYAVAVQYRPKTMRAPVVLAKGRGFLAARVRQFAQRAGVPIIRVPSLARALYRECGIDAPVPEALYGQLAPIYRQMYAEGRGGAR